MAGVEHRVAVPLPERAANVSIEASLAGVKKVSRSETDLVIGAYRTQLFNPDDLDNVKKIQAGYKAEPLSAFLALQLRVLSISESMGDHDLEVMEWQVHRSRRRWNSGRLRCGM